jgi:thiosulfate/3-mercaptopyruvate sulfurtransferase
MMSKNILVSSELLASRLDEPDWTVIDCRFDLADPDAGRSAFVAGHIPGSVYLDLDTDLAGPVTAASGRHPLPDIGRTEARLGELGIGNHTRVIVYDESHGGVAARAWWLLRWLGHDDVGLLDGGLARWRRLGMPLETGEAMPVRQQFRAAPRPELVLTTDEIVAALRQNQGLNLLDARDEVRFRGEQEPIDPVAGHIPGATSAPYSDFVNPDGTWRSLEDRKRRLQEALDECLDDEWGVMCGSGVTACHLAISALEAGLPEPRVYVGSWSEWIRDRKRPIADAGA